MKLFGQFLVGFWVLVTLVSLTRSATDPSASITWGFGFLILGSFLWYYGAKRQRDKADREWMKEQLENQNTTTND